VDAGDVEPIPPGCGPEADADAPDPDDAKVEIRQLPRLVREGLAIVWAASPGELVLLLALQLISGFLVAALLVLGTARADGPGGRGAGRG
jgi:hypothetical protein